MQIQGIPLDFAAIGLSALITILITVLFCLSLVKTLAYVAPENRAIQPSVVWLLLVPVLNYIFSFFVVFWMSKSISNELKSRDFDEVKWPALVPGLISATLSLLPLAVYFIDIPEKYMDVIGFLALFQMIFFIQYWMKINWYRQIFKQDTEENAFDQADEN